MSGMILQLAMADKTKLVTGHPAVTKCQSKIMIDFFKTELVTQRVFIEVATGAVSCMAAGIERLPQSKTIFLSDTEKRFAASMGNAVLYLVIADIGKQRCFRRHPARCQSPVR